MAQPTFACPECQKEFVVESGTEHLEAACPNCACHLDLTFFPPFYRAAPVGMEAAALVDHTQASCFYHPQKQAQRVCDGCGRLICALCSVEMADEHLCPNCLSAGKKKGRLTTLEGSRLVWDRMAMNLTILGLFLCYFTLLTAPIALYISIRHWNSSGSLLGVRKGRFVFAIIASVLQMSFWIFVILALIYAPRHAHTHPR